MTFYSFYSRSWSCSINSNWTGTLSLDRFCPAGPTPCSGRQLFTLALANHSQTRPVSFLWSISGLFPQSLTTCPPLVSVCLNPLPPLVSDCQLFLKQPLPCPPFGRWHNLWTVPKPKYHSMLCIDYCHPGGIFVGKIDFSIKTDTVSSQQHFLIHSSYPKPYS